MYIQVKHKQFREEKVEKCSFVLYHHSYMMHDVSFRENLKEVDNILSFLLFKISFFKIWRNNPQLY